VVAFVRYIIWEPALVRWFARRRISCSEAIWGKSTCGKLMCQKTLSCGPYASDCGKPYHGKRKGCGTKMAARGVARKEQRVRR